jgi:CBS domain-containing protein/sporulation protein YlmC with PRC-barrel domain
MPLFGVIFASEVLSKRVLDPKGEDLGKIRDIEIIKGEPLPKIDALILQKGKALLKLPWHNVDIFNKKVIAAKVFSEALGEYRMGEKEFLVARDILDKQIVDANGVKVVRANDLKFEGYRDDALIVAVDVGMRGILRRLGFERGGDELMRFFRTELAYNLISWNYIQPLHEKLSELALTVPRQMLAELHPADIAELISQVSHDEGASFIEALDVETAAETIMELEPGAQTAIMKDLDAEKASDIMEEMSPDAAADVLGRLSEEDAKAILEKMDREDAEDIQELLAHEKDTAGGLMTTEYVSYPPGMTVAEVLGRFREDARDLEAVYYVYVLDGEELVGVVSLRELLLAPPDSLLSAAMETKIKTVPPDEDDMKVAEIMTKYNLVAMPVVDEAGGMLGIVTIDDIVDRILPRRKRRKV